MLAGLSDSHRAECLSLEEGVVNLPRQQKRAFIKKDRVVPHVINCIKPCIKSG